MNRILFILFISLPGFILAQKTQYSVLPNPLPDVLHQFLLSEADRLFESRRTHLNAIMENPVQLKAWQDTLSARYKNWLDFPATKSPLNSVVTKRIARADVILENIIFESRPNHHVTANFFIPKNAPQPFPAVLVVCGHTQNGKAEKLYQSVAILLAQNGIGAILVDPFGQGERYQLLNEEGNPATPGGTVEHTFLDYSSNLLGSDAVNFELWDNIRALDYLESRKEVDPNRLGVTGNSGGGTQTAFLMALDQGRTSS